MKKFLQKIKANFVMLIHGIEGDIKKYLPVALHVTENIAKLLASKTVDTVIVLIDPAIKEWLPNLEGYVKQAIGIMAGIENAETETTAQVIADFIAWLDVQSWFMKHANLLKLASIILALLNGEKLADDGTGLKDYDTMVQNAVHSDMQLSATEDALAHAAAAKAA